MDMEGITTHLFLVNHNIGQVFEQELIQLPQPETVNGIQLPYTLVGDEIFPLKQWLMKPYPGSHLILEK